MSDLHSGRSGVWSIAVLTILLAVSPGANASWLSIFRTDQTKTATINPGDFKQIGDALQGKIKLVDIVNFGQLHFLSWPKRRRIAFSDLSAFSDFAVKPPPASIPGYPRVTLERVAPVKIRFTLRVRHINKLLTSLGAAALLPEALEGRSFVMTAPAQLRALYRSSQGDAIAISETLEPQLEVPDGVDLEMVRDALLSLPGFPEGLRTQLAGVEDWRHRQLTLMVGGTAREARVNGQPAFFIDPRAADPDGHEAPPQVQELHRELSKAQSEDGRSGATPMGHGRPTPTLIWTDNGVIYLLQGDISLEQAIAIAEMIK